MPNVCKICGHPFGLGELKASEEKKMHHCNLIRQENGNLRREAIVEPEGE